MLRVIQQAERELYALEALVGPNDPRLEAMAKGIGALLGETRNLAADVLHLHLRRHRPLFGLRAFLFEKQDVDEPPYPAGLDQRCCAMCGIPHQMRYQGPCDKTYVSWNYGLDEQREVGCIDLVACAARQLQFKSKDTSYEKGT